MNETVLILVLMCLTGGVGIMLGAIIGISMSRVRVAS
jgi:hypothetical protein